MDVGRCCCSLSGVIRCSVVVVCCLFCRVLLDVLCVAVVVTGCSSFVARCVLFVVGGCYGLLSVFEAVVLFAVVCCSLALFVRCCCLLIVA